MAKKTAKKIAEYQNVTEKDVDKIFNDIQSFRQHEQWIAEGFVPIAIHSADTPDDEAAEEIADAFIAKLIERYDLEV